MSKKKPTAPKPKGHKKDSLAELLKKPFSLTDCKRVVALTEEWSRLVQVKARAATETKALKKKYDEACEEGDHHAQEKAALQLLKNGEAKSECTAAIKATLSDLTRIILDEMADGSTVWAAADNAGKQEEQEPDDEAAGQLKLAQA